MKGKRCPGEEPCADLRDPRANRLARRKRELSDGTLSVEDVCRSCPHFPTKPGNVPPELSAEIELALELDEAREVGIRWREGELSGLELAALRALHRARLSAQEQQRQRETDAPKVQR